MGAAPSTRPPWRQAQAVCCHQGLGDMGTPDPGGEARWPRAALASFSSAWWLAGPRVSAAARASVSPICSGAGSPSGTPQGLGHPSQPRDSCHPQLCCPCPLSITPSAVGKPFGEREGCVCSQSEREIQIADAFLQKKLSFLRTGLTAEGGTGLLQPQSLA